MDPVARWRLGACALLAALPWINPAAPGPTASAFPWLASMACVLALWSLAGWPHPGRGVLWLAAAPVAWATLAHLGWRPELVFLAGGLVLVALGVGIGRSERPQLALAVQGGWLAAAVVTAAVGLCQYFGVAGHFAPWMNVAAAGEAYGNLRQTNQYASLCWLGVAILLWGRLTLPRGAALALVALLATAAAASTSRTGMLQGGVLAVLALLWPGPGRRTRVALCLWAGAAYLLAVLLLPVALQELAGVAPHRTLWSRFTSDASCSSRRVLWANVLHLIAQRPLAGWGWGELDYAHFMTLYRGERFCDILDNAHSLPLHLAVELGLPAALAACAGVLAWAARRRPWREQDPQRQLAWAILVLVALHSLLEYPLWYGPFQLAAGVGLGWLLGPQPELVASGRRRPLAAAVLAVLTLYAAWDYQRVSQIYLEPQQRLARWREHTLEHARRSWLFASQARFAELTLASVTPRNADWMRSSAEAMLHYSPEPRVIERAIESATMQQRYDEAVLHLARYRAAFPEDYAKWREAQQRPLPLLR